MLIKTQDFILFSLQNKIKIISHNLTFQITSSLQLRKYNNYLQWVFTWRHVNKTFVKIINQKPVFQSVFTNESLNFNSIQMKTDCVHINLISLQCLYADASFTSFYRGNREIHIQKWCLL